MAYLYQFACYGISIYMRSKICFNKSYFFGILIIVFFITAAYLFNIVTSSTLSTNSRASERTGIVENGKEGDVCWPGTCGKGLKCSGWSFLVKGRCTPKTEDSAASCGGLNETCCTLGKCNGKLTCTQVTFHTPPLVNSFECR